MLNILLYCFITCLAPTLLFYTSVLLFLFSPVDRKDIKGKNIFKQIKILIRKTEEKLQIFEPLPSFHEL